MAVRFILGRSGSGKTRHCLGAITDALLEKGSSERLIFLVPEQATYQAERSILSDKRIRGYNRLQILSFDRLQFMLSGRSTARSSLSKLGRQMIIHRILRENRSKLSLFGDSARWTGLSRQMADVITEFHNYAKGPDDIELLVGHLRKDTGKTLTAMKFADIELVFREYVKAVRDKFIDPDVQLRQTCAAIAESDFAKQARLWVDGFAGFTTSETAILTELLRAAGQAHIALCLDTAGFDVKEPSMEKVDPTALFSPTEKTYAELYDIVKKCKLPIDPAEMLEKTWRFSGSSDLEYIERNLFNPEAGRIKHQGNAEIVSAANPRGEITFTAGKIRELVKEKGWRYRDIAVIASDIGRYEHYIRASFEDHSIPFFIDKPRALSHHPAAGFIRSALQIATSGFSSSDIFAYLKSSLVSVDEYDVELLENYCLAHGIGDSDWTDEEKWRFEDVKRPGFDEKRIDKIRRDISRPLLELRDRLCPQGDTVRQMGPAEFTRIIFDFLDNVGVRQKIGNWIEQAIQDGDIETADEHRQFYDKLINLFDEIGEVFESSCLCARDYLSILESAFSQMSMAFIPPSLDQVLVGSIERSRHPDLKAVFLIGVTQKQFPSPITYGGVLTDQDRLAAEEAEFTLAAGACRTLAERQYLAYIALTRASEKLYVTYPSADEKDSAVVRSQFIDNIMALFEDTQVVSASKQQDGLENIHSRAELVDLLCRKLGSDSTDEDEGKARSLLEAMSGDDELCHLAEVVTDAVNYDNHAGLDEQVIGQLFGKKISTSAGRLSTFAACPFQHFAKYELELKKRREFKFEPLDIGDFYHRVLDSFTKELAVRKLDWAAAKRRELVDILQKVTHKVVGQDSFISNFIRHGQHNAFVIRSACEVLAEAVVEISQMMGAGIFRPAVSEASFGFVRDGGETIGDFKMSLSNNRELFFNGKIDRIDISGTGEQKAAVVFDYKRSGKSFSWPEFYNGLDIQLLVYMLAVQRGSKVRYEKVAGAFYIAVEAYPEKADLGELEKRAGKFARKANGIFDGDYAAQLDGRTDAGNSPFYNFYVLKDGEPYGSYGTRGALKPEDFEKVMRFAERKIAELAESIISGMIEVRPYRLVRKTPCGYCDYKSVCRFDPYVNHYNSIEQVTKTQFLERLEEKNE